MAASDCQVPQHGEACCHWPCNPPCNWEWAQRDGVSGCAETLNVQMAGRLERSNLEVLPGVVTNVCVPAALWWKESRESC